MKLMNLLKKMRTSQEPAPEFHAKLKSSLVAYLKENPPLPNATPAVSGGIPASWRKALTVSFAAFAILGTSAVGTVFASQKALPGDALYGVKLAADQIAVAVTNSPAVRVSVANRRLEEVKQALGPQSEGTPRSQADVQTALRQYQSNLQEVITDLHTTSSTSSTVQNILQQTADNEKDLAGILSEKEHGAITEDLENSLQFSRKTTETAHAALMDFGTETEKTDTTNPGGDSHSRTPLPTSSAFSAPTIVSSSSVNVLSTATSSAHKNDFESGISRNASGTKEPETKGSLIHEVPDPTQTSANISPLQSQSEPEEIRTLSHPATGTTQTFTSTSSVSQNQHDDPPAPQMKTSAATSTLSGTHDPQKTADKKNYENNIGGDKAAKKD